MSQKIWIKKLTFYTYNVDVFCNYMKYFIQKPVLKKIEIWSIGGVLNGTLFATLYAIPKLNVSDEAFDIMYYTV